MISEHEADKQNQGCVDPQMHSPTIDHVIEYRSVFFRVDPGKNTDGIFSVKSCRFLKFHVAVPASLKIEWAIGIPEWSLRKSDAHWLTAEQWVRAHVSRSVKTIQGVECHGIQRS